MKTVQLKVLALSEPVLMGNEVLKEIKYRSELLSILRFAAASDRPLSFDEMEVALSIRAKLKKLTDNGVLELEDSEADYLKQRVSQARFLVADEAYIEMKRDILSA